MIVAGDSGIILKGIGYDRIAFSEVESNTSTNLNDVALINDTSISFNDTNIYLISGDSGLVLRSTDSGETWDSVFSGVNDNLNVISVTDSLIRIAGNNGVHISSNDRGLTWNSNEPISGKSPQGEPLNILSISFKDNSVGWASGSNGEILKTTNGGNFWISQTSGITVNINKITFNSYLYGFAAGDSGRVIFTTNGGSVWIPHPSFDSLTTSNINTFQQTDSINFIAIGDSVLINLKSNTEIAPLSGVYTIGKGGDFLRIDEALSAAEILGVKDSITFLIQPGTYEEIIEIGRIFPISSSITIKGAAKDSVIIMRNTADTVDHVIKFNQANGIRIQDLTILSNDTSRTRLVYFEGINSRIAFENVELRSPVVSSNLVNKSLVLNNSSSTCRISDLTFLNCRFIHGSFGIRLFSTSGNSHSNLVVSDCIFQNNLSGGVILNYVKNLLLTGNEFDSIPSGISVGNGIDVEVSRNKLRATGSALVLSALNTSGGNRNVVYNNFVQSKSIGILLTSGIVNTDLFFNSVNIENPYDTASLTTSSAFSTFFLSGSNIRVRNNMLVNNRKGNSIDFRYLGGMPLSALDNNNYYTAGNTLALWQSIGYSGLPSFRAVTGLDSHSVSSQVYFITQTDLHLTGSSVGDAQLAGAFLSEITKDIDGNLRSTSAPYIGADESFLPLDQKVLRLALNFESCPLTDTVTVEIRHSVSPFAVLTTGTALAGQGLYTNVTFSSIDNYTPHYIVVKHRNSIATWSGFTQSFMSDTTVYNFTTAASQAFGNNQMLKGGLWSIYSGDVNQDGAVDGSDGLLIDNDAFAFYGGYIATDLNCDGIVDGSDAVVADNNSLAFVSEITP